METIRGIAMGMAFLTAGVTYFVLTCLRIVLLERNPKGLLDLKQIQHRSFVNCWRTMSHSASSEVDPSALACFKQCHGFTLDLGTGTGSMLWTLDPSLITNIVCVEPQAALHADIRTYAAPLGLLDRMQILPCGAQQSSLFPALAAAGLLEPDAQPAPLFDSIVCCRVLCGVPDQAETVKGLFKLLKPGGRITVLEHVVNDYKSPKGSYVARGFQRLFAVLGWEIFLDGCQVERDTARSLREAAGREGGWAEEKLFMIDTKSVVPFLAGYLVKK